MNVEFTAAELLQRLVAAGVFDGGYPFFQDKNRELNRWHAENTGKKQAKTGAGHFSERRFGQSRWATCW